MNKPVFDTRVSLGNVMQMLLLAGALVGGASVALSKIEGIDQEIQDIDKKQAGFDVRLRTVETLAAMQGRDFEAMNSLLGKLEAQVSENNRLLRQLLQQQPDPR